LLHKSFLQRQFIILGINSIFVKTNVPKRILYSFAIPRNHDEIELS